MSKVVLERRHLQMINNFDSYAVKSDESDSYCLDSDSLLFDDIRKDQEQHTSINQVVNVNEVNETHCLMNDAPKLDSKLKPFSTPFSRSKWEKFITDKFFSAG